MLRYVLRRFLILLVSLIGITAITFAITRLAPGDPAVMKVEGGSGSASQAMGGFDDLVERNRRNLGLDRPLLLNFRFDDRGANAHRAIDDLFRRSDFWHREAERRLARMSTLALQPALERFASIGTENDPVIKDSKGAVVVEVATPEVRRERLAKLFHRLAAQPDPLTATATPEERYAHWNAWYIQNKDVYTQTQVRQVTASFLAAPEGEVDALLPEVLKVGGHAVPSLIAALSDRAQVPRINRFLQVQTGFNYSDTEPELLAARWQSWWRREASVYTERGAVGRALAVVTDTQFGLWMQQAITFDFGDSYSTRRPVVRMIAEALPISVLLSALSILFSYLLAIPIGIFSAIRRHTAPDTVLTVILFILYSLPSFWVAGILLLTTTGPPFLTLFPTRGLNSPSLVFEPGIIGQLTWLLDRTWHLVLPVLCLTYGSLAFISRQMRSAMLETLSQDYIRTARAKGVGDYTIIFRHALRNSLIPIITISAGLLPELIAGAVIIESIFTIPGMGTLTFQAIVNRDYPVINAVLFFSALLTLLGILLADLGYVLADPRIDYL